MTQSANLSVVDVEHWNDTFAREHDIDAYYQRSGFLIRWIERRRLRAIRALVTPRPGERLLEVGCGGGHVLRQFPECELTGIDVSGEMIARARRNLGKMRVELHKGQLRDLMLPAGSFDVIVCSEVLEHVVDPDEELRQMGRLLKPGGRVVVTLPNDHMVTHLKSLIRRTGLTILPPFRRISWGGDHYHLHVWSIGEMRDMLKRHFALTSECFVPARALPIRCCFRCRALHAE
jgi:ubiquinone/menaquinone biosynthesis C-methylase UbiE